MVHAALHALGALARGNLKRLLLVGAVLALLAAGVGVTYFATPHHAQDWAVDAVQTDDAVTVARTDASAFGAGRGYVLSPAEGSPAATLVFYPGGRVHPDAYVHTLAGVAANASVRVVIPPMPLNLALLDTGAAGRYADADRPLVVGGHSLGGPAACRYADANPDRVDGIVLFASYCDVDVSDHEFAALSVTGSRDAVMNRERYRETRSNLPGSPTFVAVDGVNHSQFGSYTGQRGGQPARVSYREAHRRLESVVVPWLGNRTD